MEKVIQQETRNYDVVVIGGGFGGIEAACLAARAGLSTALVEKDQLGGAGLNRGNVSLKYLLGNAALIRECVAAKKRGIIIKGMGLDFGRMMRDESQKLRKYADSLRARLEEAGVDIFMGSAAVHGDKTVTVTMGQNIEGELKGRHLILATGAPGYLPEQYHTMPGMITDEEACRLEEIPAELVIIGGGARACEYATLFMTLGAKVTLFVDDNQLLTGLDKDLCRAAERHLLKSGTYIEFGVKVDDVYKDSLGDIHLNIQKGSSEKTVICSDILVLREHQPAMEGIADLGLAQSEKGVRIDEHARTSAPGIYAIGDLADGSDTIAGAVALARRAVDDIQGKSKAFDFSWIPKRIRTIPEMAWVGLTEEEAEARGHQVAVEKMPLEQNLQACLDGAEGFVKVILDAAYGELLGVSILGKGAGEIIAQAQIIMEMEGTAEDLKRAIHPYPSLSSALSETYRV
jgi:dihydrolipoamide dehydrogenase